MTTLLQLTLVGACLLYNARLEEALEVDDDESVGWYLGVTVWLVVAVMIVATWRVFH